jgi:hypothetical protein
MDCWWETCAGVYGEWGGGFKRLIGYLNIENQRLMIFLSHSLKLAQIHSQYGTGGARVRDGGSSGGGGL